MRNREFLPYICPYVRKNNKLMLKAWGLPQASGWWVSLLFFLVKDLLFLRWNQKTQFRIRVLFIYSVLWSHLIVLSVYSWLCVKNRFWLYAQVLFLTELRRYLTPGIKLWTPVSSHLKCKHLTHYHYLSGPECVVFSHSCLLWSQMP